MSTPLQDKLAILLAREQAELARIQTDAQTNAAAVRARIAVLEQTHGVLSQNPQLEQLIGQLQKIGVKVFD